MQEARELVIAQTVETRGWQKSPQVPQGQNQGEGARNWGMISERFSEDSVGRVFGVARTQKWQSNTPNKARGCFFILMSAAAAANERLSE